MEDNFELIFMREREKGRKEREQEFLIHFNVVICVNNVKYKEISWRVRRRRRKKVTFRSTKKTRAYKPHCFRLFRKISLSACLILWQIDWFGRKSLEVVVEVDSSLNLPNIEKREVGKHSLFFQ